MAKEVHGAALITKSLKKYGGGSLKGGLERLQKESYETGLKEGFLRGIFYKIELILQHKSAK